MREAADLIIGNLNEDGYLIASDEELLGVAPPAPPEADADTAKNIVSEAQALGFGRDRSRAECAKTFHRSWHATARLCELDV